MNRILILLLLASACLFSFGQEKADDIQKAKTLILKANSEVEQSRLDKGIFQLAEIWTEKDGDGEAFVNFCVENFLTDEELEDNTQRICKNLEILNGSTAHIRNAFTDSERFTDGVEIKADHFFRRSIPSVDFQKSKLSHFIRLNYPAYTLDEKRQLGEAWSRKDWAMVAIGDRYSSRPVSNFKRSAVKEAAEFKKYMQHYFLRMDAVSLEDGSLPFAEGVLLHSHRGLRDNCKEEYTRDGGYDRQRLTGKVAEHILLGTVPVKFLTDSSTIWNPWTNKLTKIEGRRYELVESQLEGPVRYGGFKSVFLNRSSEDQIYDGESTVLERTVKSHNFYLEEVEKTIRDFLADPVIEEVGSLISKRLQRPLEPFDIWYSGFQEQSFYQADYLDSLTRAKYPNPKALQDDVPNILMNMGFSKDESEHIGTFTEVRPVVSGGYTSSPPMRGDKAVMTTMFDKRGLDYKSYRVAMHELGHVVCAVYSADEVDNFILDGVPTNGITEAMAELLAYKNVEGLGLEASRPEEKDHLLSLAVLWYLVEMGGQALTDIESWKWIYAHPDAKPAEVQAAVLKITEDIWNQYFADVFGGLRDQHLLSIYNHFITGSLYLYNYFLGNVIMYQLHDAYKNDDYGKSLRGACKEGNTLPEMWMQNAVGAPISATPVLNASKRAFDYFMNQ